MWHNIGIFIFLTFLYLVCALKESRENIKDGIIKEKRENNDDGIKKEIRENNSNGIIRQSRENNDGIKEQNNTCILTIDNRSLAYFQSRLELDKPNCIYFNLDFNGTLQNSNKEAFYPERWIWTYATSKHVYPFIHWKIDYDIFSFNLLNVKTIRVNYVRLYPSATCNLTLGTFETTELISQTLGSLVGAHDCTDRPRFSMYQKSYWCFLAEVPGIRDTIEYFLGLYLDYPVIVLKYNCCTTVYHYAKSRYENDCLHKQMNIYPQCTLIPFVFGILLFLYCPIAIFDICAYLSKNEYIQSVYNTRASDNSEESHLINWSENDMVNLCEADMSSDSDWIYLDGTVPISFIGLFRGLFMNTRTVSRIRRLICVFMAPTLIYIKLIIYGHMQFKTINDMMDRGVPFGFLSLIANTTKGRSTSFVPALGGPVTIFLTFFILSIVFFVFPSSLKRIIEMGLPSSAYISAPLCYSAAQVKEMSQIQTVDAPGYQNASNHLRCSFYMLFRSAFWKRIAFYQKERFRRFLEPKRGLQKNICVSLLPLYVLLCSMELLIASLYYSIPLFGCVVIIIRGATVHVADKMRKSGGVSLIFLNNKPFVTIATVIVAATVTFYAYSICLVFIESFIFLSEFFVYSYLAVIIYPTISFGYLFFAVVLGYYIFRLLRGFGNRYLDLLNEVVEICLNIEQQDNHVASFEGNLMISNVKIRSVRSITVNGVVFPVPSNIRQSFCNIQMEGKDRIRYKNDAYGIPKELFDFVVSKYMPIHQQVLRVLFQLSLIVLTILFTIFVTQDSFTGPASQITDVVHVIFIVTVGALPRILEVAMSDSSAYIEHDLKMRKLEKTICEYWRNKTEERVL